MTTGTYDSLKEHTERVVNTPGLTFIDPKGVVPESVREKARLVHKEMDLGPVVCFVTERKRWPWRWCGRATVAVWPKRRIRWRGKLLEFTHPVHKITIKIGREVGPEPRDGYGAWIGSETGEGTVLSLLAHELGHVESNVRALRLLEAEVSRRAFEICRELFPELYCGEKEWKMLEVIRGEDKQERYAAMLYPKSDKGAHSERSNDSTVLNLKESTMRVGTESTQHVVVRIGKSKEAKTLKVYDAAPEDVAKVIAATIKAPAVTTQVRVKLNGKGNKPIKFTAAGSLEQVNAAIKAALDKAAE